MNVKEFLVGAGTMLVGVALGAVICCTLCSKKCDKPMPPCQKEQQCQRHDGPQHGKCHKPDQKCFMMKFAKELNLSDEQMAKIKELKESQREAMKAEREKFEASFQSILTDEQKAQLEKMKAEKPCFKDGKHHGNKPCPKACPADEQEQIEEDAEE